MESIVMHDLSLIKTVKRSSDININVFRIYIGIRDGKLTTHNISFSPASEHIKKGFLFMNMAENTLTGEKFMVFSKTEGAKIKKLSKGDNNYGSQRNLLVRYIADTIGIDYSKGVSAMIEVSENLSKQEDKITNRIMKISL